MYAVDGCVCFIYFIFLLFHFDAVLGNRLQKRAAQISTICCLAQFLETQKTLLVKISQQKYY